ncbi:MAG: site-2 protease family protein, partial [Clostridia bacterium]|nr:site-2 protease family protein [Clostridia bacterium]
STVKMVFDSLGGLLSGRFGLQSLSGPIGISEAVGQAVGVSFASLLYLFAVISVNLGIMNLLPLPVLDGGRILTIIIAIIIRRDPPPAFERAVNTVGFILLMGLTLVITFKDIFKLFS